MEPKLSGRSKIKTPTTTKITGVGKAIAKRAGGGRKSTGGTSGQALGESSSRVPSSNPNPDVQLIRGMNRTWFRSEGAIEFFQSCKPLKHPQYYLDLASFEGNLSILQEWFSAIQIDQFVSLAFDQYVDMVDMFYANMEIGPHHNMIISYVCGKKLVFTPASLADAFGIPNEGLEITKDWYKFEVKHILGIILDNPELKGNRKVTYDELDAATRIVYKYFTHFLMKQGNMTDFSHRENLLVACVKEQRPFNLPQLMINLMIERREYRPFPIHLSKLFDDKNIPQVGRKVKYPDQCLNLKKAIHNLGVAKDSQGVFALKKDRTEDSDEDMDVDTDVASQSEQESINTHLEELGMRLDRMEMDMAEIKGEARAAREEQRHFQSSVMANLDLISSRLNSLSFPSAP